MLIPTTWTCHLQRLSQNVLTGGGKIEGALRQKVSKSCSLRQLVFIEIQAHTHGETEIVDMTFTSSIIGVF